MSHSNISGSPDLIWDLEPLSGIMPEWLERKELLRGSTTQQIAWVSQWQANVNADCFCVVARSTQGLEFVLTLEVIKQGPLTIAIFPGGSHANENFACMSSTFKAVSADECVAIVKAQVKQKRPDVDVIYFNRQVQSIGGVFNPLLPVAQSVETDIALSFALKQDFQALLDAKDGSKRQKKNRKAGRRLDERGGWIYKIITDASEAKVALSLFYTLKGQRFAHKGIANVFSAADVRAFFDALFTQSITQETGEFEVHVLQVGGDIVAITGNTRIGQRINVEFSAVNDSVPNISHGEFLYFQMINNACERGLKIFSFGIGDEVYKRAWCDVVTLQYNTAVALTWKGALAARIDGLKTSTKRAVKANKRLYGFLKKVRKPGNRVTPEV
jgi:CelD/BcsL family acetyltransferase involved in cellulose biosynthesis